MVFPLNMQCWYQKHIEATSLSCKSYICIFILNDTMPLKVKGPILPLSEKRVTFWWLLLSVYEINRFMKKKTGTDKKISKVKKVTYNNNGTDKRNIKIWSFWHFQSSDMEVVASSWETSIFIDLKTIILKEYVKYDKKAT